MLGPYLEDIRLQQWMVLRVPRWNNALAYNMLSRGIIYVKMTSIGTEVATRPI